MVRKRKPLNSVDGNRVLTDAATARGKPLRRTTTDSIMDHQDDDAYDFLSASSSISSSRSRPLKRAKRVAGTSTSSNAAVHHQHHHDSVKYAGKNGNSIMNNYTKTPRISNLSAAEQKARVAAWVLPPRTPKPSSHLTTMVVMSATTNANTNTNAKTNHRPTLHPLPQRRHLKQPHLQPSLPQQRAERARERPSPGTSRTSAAHRVPPIPAPAPPPSVPSSKAPPSASNAAHAATRIAPNSLRDDASNKPQPQQHQPKLNSQPSLLQSKDSVIANANNDDADNNNQENNDDMDLDSDNESLGLASPNSISGGGVTATFLVHEGSTGTGTGTAIPTATPGIIPLIDPTEDKEWVLKAPSSVDREAAVHTEILRPVPGQHKLVPKSDDYQATDAAAAVVVHDAKQRVVNPVYPAKKPRWLRQATTPSKQPVSSSEAKDGARVAAAATPGFCTQFLTTKPPCSNATSPVQTSPLLLKALELARQRQSAKKEREIHSPSVLQLNQAPPATAKQVRLVAPKSAVQKRIEKLLRTPATHSHSMLENLEDPSSQLARPLSRNVMEKYRRSSADNEKVVRAMLQSGTPRTKIVRTPDSPIQDTLPLIGTTVKLQRCDSLDGSEMTMESLQRKIRPKVRGKVLEREQQTTRPEVDLDDPNPITEETIQVQQVQPSELQVEEEKELLVETTKVESLGSDFLRECSLELDTAEVESLNLNSTCSPELETAEVERLNSNSTPHCSPELESLNSNYLRHCSPELWTVEAAGHTNHAPIFELSGGILYRHPPMPPGWSLGVSKSKNKPYYYHPDFGTSFFCPVRLPSANGSLVEAQRVTQPREQSVGTFSISRVDMGRSPATESFATAATSNSRGDSHGATPALQSESTNTAFYSPDTVGAAARTLFAIPSGSEKLGSDTDNASGTTGESVLGTQASPRGVNAFSRSGPASQTSPMAGLQETAVEGGKHSRRQDGHESFATDEDSASHSNTTTASKSTVGTKAPTPEPLSEALAMVEIEETVARVKHARSQEGVVLAAKSLQGPMKDQHKRARVIRDDFHDSSTEISTAKHERILAAQVEYNNIRAEKRLGVDLSAPDSEKPESFTGPPDDFEHELEDELIGIVVRTPVETGSSPFSDNDNDSLVSLDNTETSPLLSGNKSSPRSNVSVNNDGPPSPSAEGFSPMARQSIRSGDIDESPPFPTDDRLSSTPRKSDRSGGTDDRLSPTPRKSDRSGGTDDRLSPTPRKSDRSGGADGSPDIPTDDGPSPTSGKSSIPARDESPSFFDDGPSPNGVQYASANNLTPHLDAQARKPSSNFSPVFSRVDSFDRESELGDDVVSCQSMMNRRKDLANLSRVISHAKPLEDEVSALNNDGMSYVDTGDYSYTSRSLHSKDSQGTSLVSRMSHRVRYPPMPLCILQNLESLPFAKKNPKRKKKMKSKKKSKKNSMPHRDVLDSLGTFS